MEIRQIKCFVAVAEELHFRRAAERMGMAQTAISAQIKNLEAELGFPLFFRTTRHVSLTQAGSTFLNEARGFLERLDAGVEAARAAANSGLDRVRVGGIDAALTWFLPSVINSFRQKFPEVFLQLTEVTASAAQVQELLSHKIDVAFFRPPAATAAISWETLFEERVFAAIPERSELAQLPSLSAEDLSKENLINYPRHSRPYLAKMVHDSFEATGIKPNIVFEVIDKYTLIQMISQGVGVGFVPQWLALKPVDGVVFRPYESAVSTLQFGVAWRSGDEGTTVNSFIDSARDEAVKTQRTLTQHARKFGLL